MVERRRRLRSALLRGLSRRDDEAELGVDVAAAAAADVGVGVEDKAKQLFVVEVPLFSSPSAFPVELLLRPLKGLPHLCLKFPLGFAGAPPAGRLRPCFCPELGLLLFPPEALG